MKKNKPWLEIYDQYGIPESLEPYPEEPEFTSLSRTAEEHGEMKVVHPGRELSYKELDEETDKLAGSLQEMGVEKGDRVASVLPTSIEFLVVDYGVTKAGAVHVPNDFLVSRNDLVYRLSRSDADILIGDVEHLDLLLDLRNDAEIDNVVLTDIHGEDRHVPSNYPSLREVINDGESTKPEVNIDVETDMHTLLFTGGTTGRPKGCMLSHRNITANALQLNATQSRINALLRGNASVLISLPLYHAFGYSTTHMFTAQGVTQVLVPDPRDYDAILELIEMYDPVIMMGVPTQFMELVDREEDLDVMAVSGSAPLTGDTRERFTESARGITQGYGLSEMSPTTHFDIEGIPEAFAEDSIRDLGFDVPTIGVPVPDVRVRLRDVETGRDIEISRAVEEGVEAEMLLSGPNRMMGYLGTDGEEFTEQGFLATGDVVKIDEKGRFYVVDRVKNMVNVSGLKVYTEEVDEVLQSHSSVRRSATIGVPDPERPGSERVKIYIEPVDGDDIDVDEVESYLEGRIAKHAMPSSVEFIDELPLTPIGKVDKESLKQEKE